MKKLLIIPAILTMTSGVAFAGGPLGGDPGNGGYHHPAPQSSLSIKSYADLTNNSTLDQNQNIQFNGGHRGGTVNAVQAAEVYQTNAIDVSCNCYDKVKVKVGYDTYWTNNSSISQNQNIQYNKKVNAVQSAIVSQTNGIFVGP